ncbi:ImmA/IrrE family metallo-endopeptidase [Gymnodinialimonas sp.]
MKFKHGFKSQCEKRSVEFRRRFGLNEHEALSADKLAEELRVTVWSAADVKDLTEPTSRTINDADDDSWLAFTMRNGPDHLVVHKPVDSRGRRNSIVMHELSHIILGHELSDACILEDGSLVPGHFDQLQENEADWLAGALLLPRPALLSIRRRGLSVEAACEEHVVSPDMLTWRIRMTGVDRQLSYRRS